MLLAAHQFINDCVISPLLNYGFPYVDPTLNDHSILFHLLTTPIVPLTYLFIHEHFPTQLLIYYYPNYCHVLVQYFLFYFIVPVSSPVFDASVFKYRFGRNRIFRIIIGLCFTLLCICWVVICFFMLVWMFRLCIFIIMMSVSRCRVLARLSIFSIIRFDYFAISIFWCNKLFACLFQCFNYLIAEVSVLTLLFLNLIILFFSIFPINLIYYIHLIWYGCAIPNSPFQSLQLALLTPK